VFKTGASNRVADALSRKEEDKEIQALTRPYWHEVAEIDREVQEDPVLAKIKDDLRLDPNSYGKYTLEKDRLYYKVKSVLDNSAV